MARFSLWLGLVALILTLGTGGLIGLEHAAPGLHWTAPATALDYGTLFALHGLAPLFLLPLLGGAAGFAAAEAAADRWGRIAGWNGLAVAAGIAGLYAAGTGDLALGPGRPGLDALVTGTGIAPDRRPVIAGAAGLWAALLGMGAILGVDPAWRWPARVVQLGAAIGTALFLNAELASGGPNPGALALALPGLALLAAASLRLVDDTGPGLPGLWMAGLLLTGAAFWFAIPGWGLQGTIHETARAHTLIFGAAAFLLLSIRHLRGGAGGWVRVTGVLVLTVLGAGAYLHLGQLGMPRGDPDVPDAFATAARDGAILTMLAWAWALIPVSRFRRPRSGAPSAVRGS